MTDKEIIKALECCGGVTIPCRSCAYFDSHYKCTQSVANDALDLINRLQAENDSLKYDMELLKQKKE